MTVTVVDHLEVVYVGEDQPDRSSDPLDARELGRERLVGLTPVRQSGEPVHERLPLDDPVQASILERDDGLAGEGLGGHLLLDVEVGAVEAQTPEAAPAGGQLELELLRA